MPSFVAALYYSLKFGCGVSPKAMVQLSNKIQFGKGTMVKPFAVIQTHAGRITIGEHCAINNFVQISTVEVDVTLDDYVRVGPHVTIMGAMRNYARKDELIIDQGYRQRGTRIGRDVLIGAGAVIFDCTIGNGAVVGAGSIVNKDVAPYQIVAGAPARVIGERR